MNSSLARLWPFVLFCSQNGTWCTELWKDWGLLYRTVAKSLVARLCLLYWLQPVYSFGFPEKDGRQVYWISARLWGMRNTGKYKTKRCSLHGCFTKLCLANFLYIILYCIVAKLWSVLICTVLHPNNGFSVLSFLHNIQFIVHCTVLYPHHGPLYCNRSILLSFVLYCTSKWCFSVLYDTQIVLASMYAPLQAP